MKKILVSLSLVCLIQLSLVSCNKAANIALAATDTIVKKTNEPTPEELKQQQEKQKIEAEKKRQELTKTEKYDPKNVSINYRDKFINKVKSKYGSFKGKNPNDIINISVYKAYETTDYEGGSRNVAECLKNGNNYNEKYIIKGVLLAKENEKYQKYTFTSTRNNRHRLAPISTINGYAGYKEGSISTDFFTEMYLKCEILPENVAKQYRK